MVLRLEVLDYADPTRWRWRLSEADGGAFVADHLVTLDPGEWQFEAFTDLHHYLRLNAVPDRRLEHEAELVVQVGDWIAARVLGSVASAVARARQPVRLEVPAGAEVLAYRPWELARVDGRVLAAHRVNFIVNHVPYRPLGKTDVGERLRMLAVFSLPEDTGALNLRKERYALAQLVHDIAAINHKGIELRVLQYGATRARLKDALLEQPSWDVVHLSGHGLPAGLILEDDAGRRDLITSTELVDLLDLAADQIKLVTLSACESAAVTAAEHLHLLGLALPTRVSGDPEQPVGVLPAVATELVRRLDCAVLAMRYPVVDDFAIALAGSFYNLVLGKGQPVARALSLALPQVTAEPPTASAPALSVATPTLFGPRTGDLRLVPPPGGPVVFQAEQQTLAEFPPQPDRFVGRVGPMTRATSALAPHSGQVGVLFHGMAGAGKTACAVELAYTHQGSFPLMAWHAAPPEGHDISTALSDFALAMERQLPGLKLAHVVNDTTALQQVLPTLTEALEHNRALIVLDNIESLLTEDGQWRDARWELLITAFTNHNGLSRLLLTSRRRPVGLPDAMVMEPVHALSLRETVLLAREWPHLCALMDATSPDLPAGQARALAARTLTTVQGHPKLIELADGHARDPAMLAKRLDDADRMWLDCGTRLEPFLRDHEPAASDQDYLTVLDGWTRATTAALPPDTILLFQFLCCLEETDRLQWVVDGNWADLWRRLQRPGQPPDPSGILTPLVEHALVAVNADPETGQPHSYRIHPGVAETGRTTAGPTLTAAVDTELAAHWLTNLQHGLNRERDEQLGWLVLRAALAAAPYLLRQGRWTDLCAVAQQVLYRDQSSATAATLLPILAAAATATRGTDDELTAGCTHARVLALLHPDHAEPALSELLDTAVDQDKFGTASAIAGDLLNLLRESGRLDEALALVEIKADYTVRAGYGPWTRLADEGWRLQILYMQGRYQQVLDAVEQHQVNMATLPESSDDTEAAIPWNVRESLLNVGVLAAVNLGHWQRALDLNADIGRSERGRGATDSEQAQTLFNDYKPLLRLDRAAQARDILHWCRSVHESTNSIPSLGKTLSAQAEVEKAMGRLDRAVILETDALRFKYLAMAPRSICSSHHNLANYLSGSGADRSQIWAHRIAATVIAYQTGSGHLSDLLSGLAGLAASGDAPAQAGSFTQVCAIVEQIDGVHLADLVARLPRRAPDGQTAMVKVLGLARTNIASRQRRHLDWWEPVISALVAARHPDVDVAEAATDTFERVLTDRGQLGSWQNLVAVLRRVHAGGQDAVRSDGLDDVDLAIVHRARDALAGTVRIDPDAWRTLNAQDARAQFLDVVVEAAQGDAEAGDAVRLFLAELVADSEAAPFVDAIRRILEGDRDPTTITAGLSPDIAGIVTVILAKLTPVPDPSAPHDP